MSDAFERAAERAEAESARQAGAAWPEEVFAP